MSGQRFSKLSCAFACCLILTATLAWNSHAAVSYNQIYSPKSDAANAALTPDSNVIIGSNGALYGMTYAGGLGFGTVFKMNPDGTGFSILHAFRNDSTDGGYPYFGGLVEDGSGTLYGVTEYGGTNFSGTLFKIKLDGSGYLIIHSFDTDGAEGGYPNGSPIIGFDGYLYVTASSGGTGWYGSVDKIKTDGTEVVVLHNFDNATGALPNSGVIQGADGTLYGTTYFGGAAGNGTVFKLDPVDGSTFTILSSFNNNTDDGYLLTGVTLNSLGTTLYGMTSSGGLQGNGTIFSIGTDGSSFSTIHTFNAGTDGSGPQGASLLLGLDGALYGVTNNNGPAVNAAGTVFKIDPGNNSFTVLEAFSSSGTSGSTPFAALVQAADGTLYGTTSQDGQYHLGTVFKIQPDGSQFSAIYAFNNGDSEGSNCLTDLVLGNDGQLYGTANFGGFANQGVVFKINRDGSGYTVLHNFIVGGTDGGYPSKLIQAADGCFYGTASAGGVHSNGIIFKVDANGNYTIVHSFNGLAGEGVGPGLCGVIQGSDSALYGTTTYGGASGVGTIYTVSTDGTRFAVMHSFGSGGDGYYPYATLIQGSDSVLYGTTFFGGASYFGTVFSIHRDGSGYQILHNFSTSDGNPYAPVLQANNDVLYGTTSSGGSDDYGTIYKLNTDGSAFVTLHSFDSTAGRYPYYGSLVQCGAIYGITSNGGPDDAGTVFGINTDGTAFATVVNFVYKHAGSGFYPNGGMVKSADGILYGLTSKGGANGFGAFYAISGLTQLDHFTVTLNATETNGVAFTGTNNLTAENSFGLAIPFDASDDPVQVSINSPLSGILSGLGSTQENLLDRSTDFNAGGVADLTAQGMTYAGIAGTGTFTVTSIVSRKVVTSGAVTIRSLKDQTITFGTISDLTYGASSIALTATSDSGLPVSYTVIAGPATVNGNTLAINGAGPVTVEANQPGNVFFNAATSVDRTFMVNPTPLSITADDATRVFGAANPIFTATFSGFVNGESPADLTGTLVSTTSATAASPVSTYAITASGLSSANYLITFVPGALTVTPASATVSLSGLVTTFNFTSQAVTVTTVPPGLSTSVTYNGSATTPTNAGSYTVVATITDPNHSGSATGTFMIAKATPVITWIDPSPIVAGTALGATQLNATATISGTFAYLPVSGTKLGVGVSQTLTAFFTPTDLSNLNPTTTSVKIDVSNAAPVFTSQPIATPNPATVGDEVLFMAAADDADHDALTYTWAFGDGSTGTGAVVTHMYDGAGVYVAKVTVADAASATASASVSVTISVLGGGATPGSGDNPSTISTANGIPDEMQSAATDAGVISVGAAQALSKIKLVITLNFAKSGNDGITLSGTLVRPANFLADGAPFIVDVGGVVTSFTLNAAGKVKNGNNSLAITLKGSGAPTSKFTIKLTKGSFATQLAGVGLTNSNATGSAVTIPVGIIFNDQLWVGRVAQTYTAKQGKSGATRSK